MLKNSKVVLFLSPYTVGHAGNFWILLRILQDHTRSLKYQFVKYNFSVILHIATLWNGKSSAVTVLLCKRTSNTRAHFLKKKNYQ